MLQSELWASLARLNMLFRSFSERSFKELPLIFRFYSLSTLPDKMSYDKVIQLCGNNNQAISKAVTLLKQGEVLAVPTDTVYGLACDASNSSGINLLYEIKGRDRNKPLAICVSTVSDIKNWGVTSDLPNGLLSSLLPGPVTVLLNRRDKLNSDLNPGVKKVGIRVPGETWYPFLHFVVLALGYPVALTSANLSNELNTVSVEEFKSLWPKLGAVFDIRASKVEEQPSSREGSTIVDLSEAGKFKITRIGVAYEKTLETLLGFGLTESI